MSKKITKIKFNLFQKGDVIDYQTIIEEKIGEQIAKLYCYDENYDRKSEINGVRVERDRAYFVADKDYEVIIRPIRKR